MTAAARAAAVTLLTIAAACSWPSAAAAHSQLEAATPAAGSTLDAAPAQVTLRFSAGVLPQYADVAVQVGDGESSAVPVEVQNDTVTGDLAALAPGAGGTQEPTAWTVAYRIVSADGHPITGEVTFSAPPPAPAPAPTPVEPPSTDGSAPSSPSTTAPAPPEQSSTPSAGGESDPGQEPDTTEGTSLRTLGAYGAAGLAGGAALVLLRRSRRRSP